MAWVSGNIASVRILPNILDFGATMLFFRKINQKRNNFIKHCPPPPCISNPPISQTKKNI